MHEQGCGSACPGACGLWVYLSGEGVEEAVRWEFCEEVPVQGFGFNNGRWSGHYGAYDSCRGWGSEKYLRGN